MRVLWLLLDTSTLVDLDLILTIKPASLWGHHLRVCSMSSYNFLLCPESAVRDRPSSV